MCVNHRICFKRERISLLKSLRMAHGYGALTSLHLECIGRGDSKIVFVLPHTFVLGRNILASHQHYISCGSSVVSFLNRTEFETGLSASAIEFFISFPHSP